MRILNAILLFALALMAQSSLAIGEDGFKGIYNGQSESSLPKTLTKSLITYIGVVEGDYFEATVLNGKVSGFRVVYIGETSDRTAISKSVSLGEALTQHSYSRATQPRLALARGRDGIVWGLVDVSHAISFAVSNPLSADSIVVNVNYLLPSAPVLSARQNDYLTEEQIEGLTESNRGNSSPNEVVLISPDVRFSYRTKKAAVEGLIDQSDIVIGKGKRTMALMQQAEIWLGVDEQHKEAKETFTQLRRYNSEFEREFGTLIKIYTVNESKFSNNEIKTMAEPLALKDQIKRGMNQLRAMGFKDFVLFE